MIAGICLVIPPSAFLLDERVFRTLGILKVASVLDQAGVTVEMLDLWGIENYEEVVRDHAQASAATCYGLTATTPKCRRPRRSPW
ncbi:MAG: hypothetical protein E6K63_12105 [Nitrospirae bacterium]|nr:MAG: hypothetical protein E6K63_12105 [Nitrospirota bacterium]